MSGISKSSVSRLCKNIDERVNAFLKRPLDGEWPCLWLEATYLKGRKGGRIVSVAAMVAVAVTTEGRREIVDLHIGQLSDLGTLASIRHVGASLGFGEDV